MCGIAGYVNFSGPARQEVLVNMCDAMVHRGPDDKGYETFMHGNAGVGFGFRRLSIIELTALGHQPMQFEDAGLTIIFNGEVYNYREIRKELEVLGYTFKSGSDTEVILKSYAQWGLNCVQRFIGMFAIAIFDKPNGKVVLFRDRAGVKPLFYYREGQHLLFGSELKVFFKHPAFKKSINYNALSLYFQRGYISAPHTIFNNTYKLLPGHYMVVDLETQNTTITKYWDVIDCYNQPKQNIAYNEALEEVERLMHSAFNYRMVADVPVGVFLSGGYDSTAVAALLQKDSTQRIKTFTIGFDDPKFNEAHHAKNVANYLGTEHEEYTCTYKDALDLVGQLPDIYDEPFGDTSAIPTTLVSARARKQVTVALSADGGDEIFAGYPKYFNAIKRIQQLSNYPGWTQQIGSVLLNPRLKGSNVTLQNKWSKLRDYLGHTDPVKRFDVISQAMTFYETQQLLSRDINYLPTPFDEGGYINDKNDLLAKFQATEYKTYMVDDILQKVDRATMSVSLEGREPFLDQRIIEFVATLPSNYKWHSGVGKRLLKDIVHKYVPCEIMERPKMGFGVPLEAWLKNELKENLLNALDESKLKQQGIFNVPAVIKMRNSYLKGEPVEFQRLSYLFLFQLWYNRWM